MSDNVIIIFKNCSVGLRSWCNTYCLQPYTALFVFIFMAATLYIALFLFKKFLLLLVSLFFHYTVYSVLHCNN